MEINASTVTINEFSLAFLLFFYFKKLIFAVYLTLRLYFTYFYSSVFAKLSVNY